MSTSTVNTSARATATIEERFELVQTVLSDILDYEGPIQDAVQLKHHPMVEKKENGDVYYWDNCIEDWERLNEIYKAVCPPALVREIFMAIVEKPGPYKEAVSAYLQGRA